MKPTVQEDSRRHAQIANPRIRCRLCGKHKNRLEVQKNQICWNCENAVL